jgi:O-antigen/teichoic acid export membrane protein
VRLPAGLARWAGKGGFAVLDQGPFAGANFLLSILLARWLSPAEYGAFALAYSIFLLAAAFHTAVVTEPMLVFGAGRYAGAFRPYLRFLVWGSSVATLPVALAMGVAGIVMTQTREAGLGRTFYALALAAPFILLIWLVRRAFYVRMQPHWAAAGGGLYLLVVTGSAVVLWASNSLSAGAAFLAMGLGGLVSGGALYLFLVLRRCDGEESIRPRVVLSDHWRYGRWASATTLLTWIPGNIYYLLLSAHTGLEEAGVLKAVMNLLMPILHATSAIAVLLVPQFARARVRAGGDEVRSSVRRALAFLVPGAIGYGAMVVMLRGHLFDWLYAGRYSGYEGVLVSASVLPVFAVTIAIIGGALRSVERPDLVFWCYCFSSLVAVGAGFPLVGWLGVSGAIYGHLASSAATAAAMWFFWARSLRPVHEAAP